MTARTGCGYLPIMSPIATIPRRDPALLREPALREPALLATIDALHRENRRRPDPTRERRLVALRRAAADVLPRRSPLGSWPPVSVDPFPGTALPEVTPAELTTDVVAGAVAHHGSLLVRGLVDPAGADRLVECIDRALDGAAERRASIADEHRPVRADDAWFAPFGRLPMMLGMGTEWVRMIDSPRGTFEFSDQLHELGRGLVADYLGEAPVMDEHKWTLRRITPDCGGAWHQDGRFLGEGVRVLNVWVALTRCGAGADAPGLEVVPRRLDILPTGTDGATFDWSIDTGLLEDLAGGDILDPCFEPGDALIFDERTAHRTGTRPGQTAPRHAIEAWFYAPSSHVSQGRTFAF